MMLMRESMKKSMIQNRTSLDGTGFDCSVCGRIYKLKSSLRNHQKWECGKEPQFKCPYCVYKAKQKMHMARHMERMHREIDYSSVKAEISVKSPSYSCQDCGKSYNRQHNLNRHQKYECKKQRNFYCPYCNYAGYQKTHIRKANFNAVIAGNRINTVRICSDTSGPPKKPYIKILAVEDLKNDKIVANIKKELSPHILFGRKDTSKKKNDETVIKQENVDETAKEKKKNYRNKICSERMKRFSSLSPESLPKPIKKKFACERDISEIKFPVDTLRCQSCGVLYERIKYAVHITQCKKSKPRKRYGCTSCPFTDLDIKEVENHIRHNHKRK
ncbi:hypothetical protein BDFB_000084 [Asbolus verrucosus]|uniref:C2H2-type domain-containing protein n=1 Tax=Asbolus verrucosus TaxID=1661398 RepID=A0A482V7M0_ASBVE|nr:hypothetical protein BDFB_000084 [Asbolus verrucosus]